MLRDLCHDYARRRVRESFWYELRDRRGITSARKRIEQSVTEKMKEWKSETSETELAIKSLDAARAAAGLDLSTVIISVEDGRDVRHAYDQRGSVPGEHYN